jgi:aryl-alcohol dehydrogenase-like predicted oxidoreductase
MEHRRLGRLEQMDSVLIFGGAALAEVSEEEADYAISASLEVGVNHFDTAAGYGDSELHLGRWMPQIRDSIFLSTKTDEREKDISKGQIHNSLERLGVDYVDLLQLHAVGNLETLDRVTRNGGSLEAALEAREEGLVHAIGITGHGHQTPIVHLEALRRYSFDTVMTPWNFVLSRDDSYRRDYEALLEEVKRQDVGLMAIKTVSKRNWPEGDPLSGQRYTTWYEPFDEQEYMDAAVAFVLSCEQITSIPMVGDVGLISLMIEAEEHRMHVDEAVEILSQAPDYSSPFIHIPF